MKKIQKEKLEAFHFNLFKKCCSDFPIGKVVHLDAPDFLIHTTDGILGVEHTSLYHESRTNVAPLQSIEGTQGKILKKAKIICLAKKILPINVKVLFKTKKIFENSNLETINFKRAEIDHISKKLSSCIIEYYTQNLDIKESLNSSELNCKIEGIDKVYVNLGIHKGQRLLETHRWQSISSGFVHQNFVKEIQERINDKNKKYCNYLEKCEECWLLIIADRSNPSQSFQINQATEQHTYESYFNAVFYFELMEKKLVRLNCKILDKTK